MDATEAKPPIADVLTMLPAGTVVEICRPMANSTNGVIRSRFGEQRFFKLTSSLRVEAEVRGTAALGPTVRVPQIVDVIDGGDCSLLLQEYIPGLMNSHLLQTVLAAGDRDSVGVEGTSRILDFYAQRVLDCRPPDGVNSASSTLYEDRVLTRLALLRSVCVTKGVATVEPDGQRPFSVFEIFERVSSAVRRSLLRPVMLGHGDFSAMNVGVVHELVFVDCANSGLLQVERELATAIWSLVGAQRLILDYHPMAYSALSIRPLPLQVRLVSRVQDGILGGSHSFKVKGATRELTTGLLDVMLPASDPVLVGELTAFRALTMFRLDQLAHSHFEDVLLLSASLLDLVDHGPINSEDFMELFK